MHLRKFFLDLIVVLMSCGYAAAQTVPSVDDFFEYEEYGNFDLSPDGRYLAITDFREDDSRLRVVDLQNGHKSEYLNMGDDAAIRWASWATSERLLVSVTVKSDVRVPVGYYVVVDGTRTKTMPDVSFQRIIAVNRDGSNPVALFSDTTGRLASNFNLSRLTSILRSDPDHILMPAMERTLSLFKVNIMTGAAERIEKGKTKTYGWKIDKSGNPVVRFDYSSGRRYIKIYIRAPGEKDWEKIATVREEDLEKFTPVAPTDNPGIYYVSARPDGYDRSSIFRYDLRAKTVLEPVSTHSVVDLYAGLSDSAGNYIGSMFFDDRLQYDFKDDRWNAHLKAVNQFFNNEYNVYVKDISDNGARWLLYAAGPRDPGSYYTYDTQLHKVEIVADTNKTLPERSLGRTDPIKYTSRDGTVIRGYLTHPAVQQASQVPLIVMPHGGPELRDNYGFDVMVQFFASRGYRVFQPNFRGSSGYGKRFAEAGYGQWGGLMQDDISDGVQYLIKTGKATPGKICIAGASFGGYAALMGAIKTPDLYNCAVSVNGATDLKAMVDHGKGIFGKDSEVYAYQLKAIGDPRVEKEKLMTNSPVSQAAKIKIPVLLIHGRNDGRVPYQQSLDMQQALALAGKDFKYVELEGVNHNLRGIKSSARLTETKDDDDYDYGYKLTLKTMEDFFAEHLK